MRKVICAIRNGWDTYYLDPDSGEQFGPFRGPKAVRVSLAERHGDEEFILVHNMSGKLEMPKGIK